MADSTFSYPLGGVLLFQIIFTTEEGKAEVPMLVTPLPTVTLISPVHPKKAELPMVSTLLGMSTLVKPVQL